MQRQKQILQILANTTININSLLCSINTNTRRFPNRQPSLLLYDNNRCNNVPNKYTWMHRTMLHNKRQTTRKNNKNIYHTKHTHNNNIRHTMANNTNNNDTNRILHQRHSIHRSDTIYILNHHNNHINNNINIHQKNNHTKTQNQINYFSFFNFL